MTRARLPLLLAGVLLAALAPGAPALETRQGGVRAAESDARPEARLDGRVDSATRQAVQRIVDAARRDGLPVEPLVSKALEGATKHAPGARIVSVVQTLAGALRDARATLGAGAAESEVTAGAAALQAGMRTSALARLKASRPNRPLTLPLVVLADLVTRGVPADTASAVLLTLSQGGATDTDFLALRRDVERDIVAGAPPAAAAALRARGFPLHGRAPAATEAPRPSSRGSPP